MIGTDTWRPHLNRLCPLGIYEELVQVKVPILPFKERVSKSLVIISSPIGWPQEEIYGNPYEKHISEWKPEEFENLGYKVKVVDAVVLPRTLKLVDKMRRAIFRLPHPRLV
jgi:hypothetical protein